MEGMEKREHNLLKTMVNQGPRSASQDGELWEPSGEDVGAKSPHVLGVMLMTLSSGLRLEPIELFWGDGRRAVT